MDYFNCPDCTRACRPRWSEHHATHSFDWYVCVCRHAFKTVAACDGSNRMVVAQSRKSEPKTLQSFPNAIVAVGKDNCPQCGVYGKIKMTYPERPDGKWRRYKCTPCDIYYHSVEKDGTRTVFRKMRSSKAFDLLGEDA